MKKCKNCKHATEYTPGWIYPHGNPRCSIHHRNILPDDTCKNFELIGDGGLMRLRFEDGFIIDTDRNTRFNVNDADDMIVLCKDINHSLYLADVQFKKVFDKLESIKAVLK